MNPLSGQQMLANVSQLTALKDKGYFKKCQDAIIISLNSYTYPWRMK